MTDYSCSCDDRGIGSINFGPKSRSIDVILFCLCNRERPMKILKPPQNYVLSRQPVNRKTLPHFNIKLQPFLKNKYYVAKYDPGEANKGFFTANVMLYTLFNF